MFCFKCGQEVPDESDFCLKCGQNLSLFREIEGKSNKESNSLERKEEKKAKSSKKAKSEKDASPMKEKQSKMGKKSVSPWVAAFCSVFVTIAGLIVGFHYGISNDFTETMTTLPNFITKPQTENKGQTDSILEVATDSGLSHVDSSSDEIYGDLLKIIGSVAENGFHFDYESLGLPNTLPLFQEHADHLGYAYFDVNNDGTSELFIGLEGEKGSIMAFTTVDDEIFLISAVEESHGSTLTSDGTFYHWGTENDSEITLSESTFSHIDIQTKIPIFDEIETYMSVYWLSLPEEQRGWYQIPVDFGYISENDDMSQFTLLREEEMKPFYERVEDGFDFDLIPLEITTEVTPEIADVKYEFYDFSSASVQFEGLEIPDFVAFATDGKVATSPSSYEINTPENYALYQYDATFLSSLGDYANRLKELGFETVVDGHEGFYCLTQEIDGVLVQIETYYSAYSSILTVKISLSSPHLP